MTVSKARAKRIGQRIQEELSVLLLREASDPRLQGVNVTDVEVDRELAYATIFVSAVEGMERKEEILTGLRSARGYLRSELAGRIELHAFPQLRFRWDETPARGARIDELLAKLNDDEPPANPEESD
ncbi:MAG: 30S ribosome-binding factor RbfA [Anaerolineales bacterium]|nr:30S ribosome-binding factor RbfA [Anaerolineales bacterium]